MNMHYRNVFISEPAGCLVPATCSSHLEWVSFTPIYDHNEVDHSIKLGICLVLMITLRLQWIVILKVQAV